jgi:hypothetical protein
MPFLDPTKVDPQVYASLVIGFRVDKASATLPASVTQNLFTIAGGRILLLGILGQVTTLIQTQACNAKLISTPTTGTAVDLCAVLDITADEVGCLYGITGTPATALVGANAGYAPFLATPAVVPIGVIGFNTSATNTGATKWTLYYLPLDEGAAAVSA